MECPGSFGSIHHGPAAEPFTPRVYGHGPAGMGTRWLRAVTSSSRCFTATAAAGGAFCFSYRGDISVLLSTRPNGQVLAGFGHRELIKVQRLCPALIHQREQPTPLQGRTPGFSFWFAFPALQNGGSLVTQSQFGSAQLVPFSINPSNSLSDLGHVTSLPESQLISWKEGCVTPRAVSVGKMLVILTLS